MPAAETPPPANALPTSVPRWRWGVHLLLLGSYIALAALLGRAHAAGQAPALTGTAFGLIVVSFRECAAFAFVFCVAVMISRASPEALLLRWRGRISPVMLGLGYSVAIRLATYAVVFFVLSLVTAVLIACRMTTPDSVQQFAAANRPNVEALVDTSALHGNRAYFWLTVTLVSFVVAGLREELWRAGFLAGLRAVWPGWFGDRKGQVAAVAVAAVVFGCGHLAQGSLAMGLTGVLGFGLGLVMVLHRSVWPAVFAHGFFDAATFVALAAITKS